MGSPCRDGKAKNDSTRLMPTHFRTALECRGGPLRRLLVGPNLRHRDKITWTTCSEKDMGWMNPTFPVKMWMSFWSPIQLLVLIASRTREIKVIQVVYCFGGASREGREAWRPMHPPHMFELAQVSFVKGNDTDSKISRRTVTYNHPVWLLPCWPQLWLAPSLLVAMEVAWVPELKSATKLLKSNQELNERAKTSPKQKHPKHLMSWNSRMSESLKGALFPVCLVALPVQEDPAALQYVPACPASSLHFFLGLSISVSATTAIRWTRSAPQTQRIHKQTTGTTYSSMPSSKLGLQRVNRALGRQLAPTLICIHLQWIQWKCLGMFTTVTTQRTTNWPKMFPPPWLA